MRSGQNGASVLRNPLLTVGASSRSEPEPIRFAGNRIEWTGGGMVACPMMQVQPRRACPCQNPSEKRKTMTTNQRINSINQTAALTLKGDKPMNTHRQAVTGVASHRTSAIATGVLFL